MRYKRYNQCMKNELDITYHPIHVDTGISWWIFTV